MRTEDGPAEPWWSRWWAERAGESCGDRVLERAARDGFVLTAAELAELGVTRARSRTLLARGTWTAAGHGYIAPLRVPTPRHRHVVVATAAARRRPRDAIGGRSAAVLWGLPLMGTPDVPRLIVRDESLGRARTCTTACFTGWLSDSEMTCWHGAPTATVERTLVDLARHDSFDGIMAADEALRLGLAHRRRIDAALQRAAGWPGIRRARDVLALADARAESPLESVTRLRLHDDGFPPPELQFPIGPYFADICWPWLRLVLEVDGSVKYRDAEGPDVLWAEKQRETALRHEGFRVERVIARDIFRGWPRTSSYLRQYFPLPRRVG